MWVTFVSFVDHIKATYVFMQKVMVKDVNYVKMSSEEHRSIFEKDGNQDHAKSRYQMLGDLISRTKI